MKKDQNQLFAFCLSEKVAIDPLKGEYNHGTDLWVGDNAGTTAGGSYTVVGKVTHSGHAGAIDDDGGNRWEPDC
ncbi:MAG TPA: hypothetical protein VK717_01680 [Opitutaceae bacterium]|jgi:hypothetical protein|nr:hypothetical protein [Opitutaceae bacterium]